MVKLWIHECSRVFHDRLLNSDDRNWFQNLIKELIRRNFGFRLDKDTIFAENGCIFGDLSRLDVRKEYEDINYINKLIKVLDEK